MQCPATINVKDLNSIDWQIVDETGDGIETVSCQVPEEDHSDHYWESDGGHIQIDWTDRDSGSDLAAEGRQAGL